MIGTKAGKTLSVSAVPCPAPAEAILIPASAYPVPLGERDLLLRLMAKLSSALMLRLKLASEMFIHLTPSKNPAAGGLISPHARAWMPQPGFGVWPAREPPSLWKKEDFADLEPGQPPRDTVHPVFRISKDGNAKEQARSVMFGTGAILEILTRESGPVLVRRGTELLLPKIQETAFRSFPYYLPLLDAASIARISFDELQTWLCGGRVYLRESIEDGGLLVVALDSIRPALETLNAVADPNANGVLRIPLE